MFYLSLLLLQLIIAQPLVNLYYTENISESDDLFLHDCLRTVYFIDETTEWEHNYYCLSEFPSQFHLNISKTLSSWTFAQLRRRNITVQQLFYWSASIDLIENYQIYLNQPTSSLLANERFFNCTLPRFGSKCQYELVNYQYHHSTLTLDEMIKSFYDLLRGYSKDLTCYVHLQCDYGTKSLCLDWTDICNGEVNCLNDGIDERDCWQLEINQCNENEHRCKIGQCIPKSFYQDGSSISDCIDESDNYPSGPKSIVDCLEGYRAGFQCANQVCHQQSWTSSCQSGRRRLISNIFHSSNGNFVSDQCWLAFTCFLNQSCPNICQFNSCLSTIVKMCPEIIFYPTIPILFGDLYLAYHKKDLEYWSNLSDTFIYVCYNTSHYYSLFVNYMKKIQFNTFTCIPIQEVLTEIPSLYLSRQSLHENIRSNLYYMLKQYHFLYNYTNEICNQSNMYQCIDSIKCISIYRLFDDENNCPYGDDEDITVIINNTQITKILDKTHRKCPMNDKYFSLHNRELVLSCIGSRNPYKTDYPIRDYLQNEILFPYICDGYIDRSSVLVDGQSENDESECEKWECNNIYTRCDRELNCPNFEDELDCYYHSELNCSFSDPLCMPINRTVMTCLPKERINDGTIDCFGGSDEMYCQQRDGGNLIDKYFYCQNQTSYLCLPLNSLCDGHVDCERGDDEKFCKNGKNFTIFSIGYTCPSFPHKYLSNIEHRLCKNASQRLYNHTEYFRLVADGQTFGMETNPILSNLAIIQPSIIDELYNYHFGLNVRIWFNEKNRLTCFCPPNYYGNQCQYQNQRISLVLQFRTYSDSRRTLFSIFILLIDDSTEKIIHSVEQLTYLSVINCKQKFNVYLFYSTRPKDWRKEYAIHMDIYETKTLKYRGSVLYPIQFTFLPVHRLAYLVQIPSNADLQLKCYNWECIHGQCIKYWNDPKNFTFCQCEKGWSGKYCQISSNCDCSLNSKCLDVLPNNRSICLCSQNEYGSRCYLTNFTCQKNENSSCLNDGQCISDNNLLISNRKFQCLCPEGFTGDRCETNETRFNISFEKDIISEQKHIMIHLIEIHTFNSINTNTFRTTIVERISMGINSIEFFWSKPFHLIFVELSENIYYLVDVQSVYKKSFVFNRTIRSSHRCRNLSELFNQTFLQWPLMRQIKSYHLPCQNLSLNLSCFHDHIHFCLCYSFHGKRLSNCFQFDQNYKYSCLGESVCENDAQCFQDDETCPKRTICACKPCFYGQRCQYQTTGFGLSLDAILSEQIIPMRSLSDQSIIIKISLTLIVFIVLIGLINGILSLLTFKSELVCEIGCGLYLFGLSIVTIVLMILFLLKFVFLLLIQMTILSNELILQIQCYSLDYLIQICLYYDQWLHACVAIERVITTIQGARFQKDKSRQTAKCVMFLLCLIISGSVIHDPFSRQVIVDDNDDENEIKRSWCILRYSSILQVYHSIIHTIHFFGPFLCNLICSILLIIVRSRQQKNLQKKQTYKSILKKQFQEHKHILCAPIILIVLALPRLILTYISKCMETESNIWLYLSIYLITFLPSMLTFIIFILPSKFYKKEFQTMYKNIKQRF